MGQDEEEQTGGAGLGNGGRDLGREETLTAQADLGTSGAQERRARSSPERQRPRGRAGEKKVGAGALVGVGQGQEGRG